MLTPRTFAKGMALPPFLVANEVSLVKFHYHNRDAKHNRVCRGPAWIVSWIIHNRVTEKRASPVAAIESAPWKSSIRSSGSNRSKRFKRFERCEFGWVRPQPTQDERRSRDCLTVGRFPDSMSSRRRV